MMVGLVGCSHVVVRQAEVHVKHNPGVKTSSPRHEQHCQDQRTLCTIWNARQPPGLSLHCVCVGVITGVLFIVTGD